MYVGRFLIVTPTLATYRVSSRSFPNRQIIERDDALAVVPTDDAPPTDNPYVSYHCLRIEERGVTIGNGAHVDPIAEKLSLGYPPRDALAAGLLAMDYEKDEYDTPRIGAILDEQAYIGIVRKDALIVESIDEPTLVATYERDEPTPYDVDWEDVASAARASYEVEFDHPVCAAAVGRRDGALETAIYNGPEPE